MRLGNTLRREAIRTPGRAHVVVLGNEKGGSGKSTTAMHLAVALLHDGAKVGTIDVDGRQGTFTRYVENRHAYARTNGIALPTPEHRVVLPSELATRTDSEAAERERFGNAFAELGGACDFLIIDTPGSHTHLSRLAHIEADTLLTPLNDSFIDLDLLARVEPDTLRILRPSVYSEAVWQQRQMRAAAGHRPVDWIVMRNRLATLDARNKRDMEKAIAALAQRLGFRVAPGLSERVIYRELFLKGLTLLDLRKGSGVSMTLSHVAARQEVRTLLAELNLPPPVAVAAG
ncbi:MAG: division plane positioning ATPase MipZ [Reyranellaceae bacterium]